MMADDKKAEPLEVDGIINPAEYRRRYGHTPVSLPGEKPRRYWKGRVGHHDSGASHNPKKR
ncbi:MAG: hypothetical protein ACR2PR_11300 [Pseudohongiellaceae bacterium]